MSNQFQALTTNTESVINDTNDMKRNVAIRVENGGDGETTPQANNSLQLDDRAHTRLPSKILAEHSNERISTDAARCSSSLYRNRDDEGDHSHSLCLYYCF